MSTYTLLNAVTETTTSTPQNMSGITTIVAKTSGDLNNMGNVRILLNEVHAVTLDIDEEFGGYAASIPLGNNVPVTVKANGTTSTPITVVAYDQT